MKRNLYLLYTISLLQGMVFYSSVATLYRQAVGVTIFQITLIESISLILTIAFELPWGVFADRIGYKRTFVICNMLFFVSKIIFWQAESFFGFLSERILLSVVISGLSGVDSSILYLSCKKKDVQRAFSIYQSLGTVGVLAAAGIYAVFVGEDYRLAGFLTMISYGAAAILSLGTREVKPEEEREKVNLRKVLAVLKEMVSNRRLLLLVVAGAVLGQVNQTITVFFNQLQYVNAGMSPRAISVSYMIVTISGMAGVFSAGLSKRIRPIKFGVLCFGGSSVACVLLAFTDNPWSSVLAVVLISVFFNLFNPLYGEQENAAIDTKDRATALSMNAVIADLIAVVTNLIFGKLAELDLSAAMGFGAMLCVTGLIMYLMSQKLKYLNF